MNEILTAIEASALGRLVRDSVWLFPAAEILHFVGLSLLLSSLLIVDLCLLGKLPQLPLDRSFRFLRVTVLGFAINACTGILFICSDPFRYYSNPAFRVKMLLVVLAGLNALWFKRAIYDRVAANAHARIDARTAEVIAVLSLSFWIGVIFMGRFIPYVED